MDQIDMFKWKKNFFLIWSGQAVSQLTSSVLQFAIVWYLTAVTASPWVLSMAMLFTFLPRAIFGPFIGVIIDRYSRKRIMLLSDLFIAGVSMLLVVASFFYDPLPLNLVYAVLFFRALGSTFHEPCLQAVTPQIVPIEELSRCAGYSQSLESVSMILGPALALLLYQKVSLNTIILFDVGGAFIAAAALSLSKIPSLKEKKITSFSQVIDGTKKGARLLKGKPGLLGLALVSTLYSFALMPISTYFPLMAIDYFGGGEPMAAMVEIIFAFGFLAGSMIMAISGGTKNKINLILLSFGIMATSLFTIGSLSPDMGNFFHLSAFFMGISGPFFWGMYQTLLQQSYPHHQLGRVLSITRSMSVMTSPFGMIISGNFAEHYGAQPWFTVAGGIVLAAFSLVFFIPAIRNSDLDSKEMQSHDLSL